MFPPDDISIRRTGWGKELPAFLAVVLIAGKLPSVFSNRAPACFARAVAEAIPAFVRSSPKRVFIIALSAATNGAAAWK